MGRKAFVQIPVLVGLLLMAVALPVANKLVKNNQDTRNKAAHGCTVGYVSNCIFMNADCTTRNTCEIKPIATATIKPISSPIPTNKICEEGMKDWCIYRYANCREENRCTQTPTPKTKIVEPTKGVVSECSSRGGGTCLKDCPADTRGQSYSCDVSGMRCCVPIENIPTPGGSYKLSITYNCGSQGCAWNQKAQQWVVEGEPFKTKIVCVDDSSCRFIPTPTSYAQKTCVQWKLDGSGKCIGYEIKLYHTQAEGVVCERDYASNCNINKPTNTKIPTIKVSPTSTVKKNPTPSTNGGVVIGMCETGLDYDHNGVANSLDMLKCFLDN